MLKYINLFIAGFNIVLGGSEFFTPSPTRFSHLMHLYANLPIGIILLLFTILVFLLER